MSKSWAHYIVPTVVWLCQSHKHITLYNCCIAIPSTTAYDCAKVQLLYGCVEIKSIVYCTTDVWLCQSAHLLVHRTTSLTGWRWWAARPAPTYADDYGRRWQYHRMYVQYTGRKRRVHKKDNLIDPWKVNSWLSPWLPERTAQSLRNEEANAGRCSAPTLPAPPIRRKAPQPPPWSAPNLLGVPLGGELCSSWSSELISLDLSVSSNWN